MDRILINECGAMLKNLGLSVAFAESATAGRLSAEFSLPKDSGKFLKGGIICYDANLKKQILQVAEVLIDEFTPESAEVTYAITIGLLSLIEADIHIGVTGLTTAGGSETPEKPVGTMFSCGVIGENKIFEDRSVFEGTQEEIINQAINRVAFLLKKYLLSLITK